MIINKDAVKTNLKHMLFIYATGPKLYQHWSSTK